MRRLLVVLVALVMGGASLGCTEQPQEMAAVRAQVDSLKTAVRSLARLTLLTPSAVTYQLSDLARNSKTVGYMRSDVQVTKGDRIFLGDDMWDVTFVKVYTTPTAGSDDVQSYSSGTVELLVTFAGKARDPDAATK